VRKIQIPEIFGSPHCSSKKWNLYTSLSIPAAAPSMTCFCDRSRVGIAVSNLSGGSDVCRECCVFSSRDLCDGLIARPEESYRLWFLSLSVITKTQK
jgi:hypothetical protein